MPVDFTHAPPEIERKEPGIGGKPPLDLRPTGGGGGGGDDDWQRENRGPRALLRKIRLFEFLFLSCDMVMFAVLVVVFFARQASMHMDPQTQQQVGDWHPIGLPPILFLNTAALLLSSLTMEIARHNIFREFDVLEEWLGLGRPALTRTLPWIAATLILGMLFLVGQWTAWQQLTAQGFAFDSGSTPSSYFFYLISGFHAAHLVAGILLLLFCLCGLSFLKRVELRQVAVDMTAWYWHVMGLAWVLLFAVLVAGQ
ncbi:MAG: cytochrome c oxidase subunit 3 [Acidobacteriota bacterium]|nr:cytochrome c oxidase subunit 3 [Acidobacteriota bacterium]